MRHTGVGWMRRVASVLALAAAGVVLAPVSPACACTCTQMTEEEYAHSAGVIFVGVVRGVDESLEQGELYPVTVQFDVIEVHKGQVPPQLSVNTGRHSAACGYYFQESGRYLVYARDNRSGLVTSLCSGNRDLARASDPFGTGWPPAAASTTPPAAPSAGSNAVPVVVAAGALAVLVLAVLVLAVWFARRVRSPRRSAASGT